MENQLLIKNMVCPRCIEAVEETFFNLGIPARVQLGKAIVELELNPEQKQTLALQLQKRGFELLESGKSAQISLIKTIIIDLVHHRENHLQENLSSYLSEAISQDYSSMSRLFSAVEGITIERFYTLQKIEKVKELLFYGELNLSEIAHKLGYSSVAYLSAQFKKETGMTPSEFKKNGEMNRKALDTL
jgi:AraC-like DNA-binding protein